MSDEKEKKGINKLMREAENAIDELRILNQETTFFDNNKYKDVVPSPPYCSFCKKGANQVEQMITGDNAYICSSCIKLMNHIIESGIDMNELLKNPEMLRNRPLKLPKPDQ